MVSAILPQSTNEQLFGGGHSSSSSTPTDVTPAVIAGLRDPYTNILKGLFAGGLGAAGTPAQNPLSGIPQYQGDLAAPLTQAEQDFLTQLQQLGGGAGSDLLAKTAAGAFVPQNGQLDPFTSAAIQSAIAPFQRQQEEFLRRTLPAAQVQAGQVFGPGASSAASRFGAVESADIAQRAAEAAGTLALNQYQQERTNQQNTIALGQQEVQTTINNLQAQALPRLIQELGIERGLSEFQNRINALLQALAVVSGNVVNVAQTSQSSSSELKGELNNQVAANLASGAGTAIAASDERLKTDIVLLHMRRDHIGIYSFRFKGETRKQVGVLAQEVEQVYPSAVETRDGIRFVHYDRIPACP